MLCPRRCKLNYINRERMRMSLMELCAIYFSKNNNKKRNTMNQDVIAHFYSLSMIAAAKLAILSLCKNCVQLLLEEDQND